MRGTQLIRTNKHKQPIWIFRRLNRLAMVADDEIADGENFSWRNSPVVSERPPRETLFTLTTPKTLTKAGSVLAWVDGTSFKYNNVTKGTVTASLKSVADLNEKLYIFPDKKSYDYLLDTFATMVAAAPAQTDPAVSPSPTVAIPAITLCCTYNNRIFGVKDSTIYACALGNPLSWQYFYPVSSQNSFEINWDTEGGDFTAICSYQDHVILFKLNSMLQLYNVNPPYNIVPINKLGCIGQNAIVEVNLVLYFAGSQYIYAFEGGLPRQISEILNVTYLDAVLGGDDRYVYANLEISTDVWQMYVYDTQTGAWASEDDLSIIQFTKQSGHCIGLASTGEITKFNSGTETGIEWYLKTKPFNLDTFRNKYLTKVRISLYLDAGASATLLYSVNDGPFFEMKTFAIAGHNNYTARLLGRKSDRVQLKLSGTGGFNLMGIQPEYAIGEDG